ncbi:uncharacterized protein LOC124809551 [Hydra vulgaris]|uniref:uncharacterized protein LOC124809551 n=1 Tax=Hydra vulgaris TaxID=6087 RepID=UPI001F5F1A5E|nr:uncharacterized protein LOC124809551 [Hydra vulgaris]
MTGAKRLSMETRIRVVLLAEQGHSHRQIATDLKINRKTVDSLVIKHKNTGSVGDLAGRGRKRATTEREDRQLIRMSKRNRWLTSPELKKAWNENYGVDVTSHTVRKRLRAANLRGCVAAKKPLLSEKNCRS